MAKRKILEEGWTKSGLHYVYEAGSDLKPVFRGSDILVFRNYTSTYVPKSERK